MMPIGKLEYKLKTWKLPGHVGIKGTWNEIDELRQKEVLK
jgi:hypothetical protein